MILLYFFHLRSVFSIMKYKYDINALYLQYKYTNITIYYNII